VGIIQVERLQGWVGEREKLGKAESIATRNTPYAKKKEGRSANPKRIQAA